MHSVFSRSVLSQFGKCRKVDAVLDEIVRLKRSGYIEIPRHI